MGAGYGIARRLPMAGRTGFAGRAGGEQMTFGERERDSLPPDGAS